MLHRLALLPAVLGILAAPDQLAHIDADRLAHHDVVAAGAERIAAADRDTIAARVAGHFQPVDHAPAVQLPVVQPVLAADIAVEPVEVVGGQHLAGEEARPAQAFQHAAGAAHAGFGRAGGGALALALAIEVVHGVHRLVLPIVALW
ncbi:hypothetical protein D9M72_542460 [compost metagenome]